MQSYFIQFTAHIKEPRHPGLPVKFTNDMMAQTETRTLVEGMASDHMKACVRQGGMFYVPEGPYVSDVTTLNGHIYVPFSSISHVALAIKTMVSTSEKESIQ